MNSRLGPLLFLLPVLAAAGCSAFEDTKPKLKGERISILSMDKQLTPDPALADLEVQLPKPAVNAEWPEPGGFPNHAMQHLALGEQLADLWHTSIGDGSSRREKILAEPVIVGDRIYTMDADYLVKAFDRKDGRQLWEKDVKPEDVDAAVGGGVAFADGHVFVTTGYAQVLALDAADGKEAWHMATIAPLRTAPTVADGRVFVVTVDNELDVFAASDGHKLWTHTGTPETAALAGGASPAVEGDVVVVPYSSGELFALRVENGRELWSESLAGTRSGEALATVADIAGRPVIDRGRIYAISHSGRMLAIDLRSGQRVWEQEIGGTETPWVAGDFVYVVSNEQELICLTRRDGRIRWIQELPRWGDPGRHKEPIYWTGPVLGGDRLILAASNGEAMSYSPYNGKPLGHIDLSESTFVTPVIADQTLYLLTDEASLIAMR